MKIRLKFQITVNIVFSKQKTINILKSLNDKANLHIQLARTSPNIYEMQDPRSLILGISDPKSANFSEQLVPSNWTINHSYHITAISVKNNIDKDGWLTGSHPSILPLPNKHHLLSK